jgi:membrane associated rhomboid family serine protease
LIHRTISSFLLILGFVITIWLIELVNSQMDYRLNVFGIVPRTSYGLIGIPLSPFLHFGLNHLVSNTIIFLGLSGLIAFRGSRTLLSVSVFIILVGGLGVWAFGRPATHIGASGLVFGYFGYLVARGWYERRPGSILIAIIVIVLYGGLIVGVLPAPGFVSWEAHLFGLIAGVLAARYGRRNPRKRGYNTPIQ